MRAFKEPYLREAYRTVFRKTEDYRELCRTELGDRIWCIPCAEKGKRGHAAGMNGNRKTKVAGDKSASWQGAVEDRGAVSDVFAVCIFHVSGCRLKEKLPSDKEIQIMGDVPFYVGVDSVDVWAAKDNFLLDTDGRPIFIAGVPPDYFSATGQRWGNPIYDWEYLKENDYQFWVDRIGYSSRLFDIIRIDHFRAFDTFWKIPASCPTAMEGEWIEAPGYEVIDTLKEKIPGVNLVAEDLGDLRPEVLELEGSLSSEGHEDPCIFHRD